MNQSLTPVLTPRQQAELHALLAGQVKSYHKHYHMGDNTSVPTEVARELLHSVWYTLDLGSGDSLKERLASGQAVLESRLEEARRLHALVAASAPEYANQCHWETMASLDRYLRRYDHRHFAHRVPEELDYPLLVPVPEELQGLDQARYILNCLWLENQILCAFPEGAVSALYGSLPPDYWEAPQNLCEQPLINALGRLLLGKGPDSLLLSDWDREALPRLLGDDPAPRLLAAGDGLRAALDLAPAAADYARAVITGLLPRLRAALPHGDLSYIFL